MMRRTAASPWACGCWAMVVSPKRSPSSCPSMPTTEKSLGTFRPRSRAAMMAPKAISSEAQSSAVGRPRGLDSRLRTFW